MIYDKNAKKKKIAGFHDPQSVRPMTLLFRAPVRENNKVYYHHDDDNYDIVVPPTYTGLIYKCKHTGKSASTPPTMGVVIGEETADGTQGLIWEASDDGLLPPDVDVSTVTYAGTNGVTLSSVSNTATKSDFTIDVLPAAAISAGEFEVTAHVTFSNGAVDDFTLVFKVGDK